MDVEKEKEKVNSAALAWQRLKRSVSETEPKDLVKFIVIAVCLFMVYIQMVACYKKLENPAITTHTQLKLNKTMEYPAVTFCREPGFKKRKYEKYNLGSTHVDSFPRMNQYAMFNFSGYTLSEFFTDAVYDEKEVFTTHALMSQQNLTRLRGSSLHLTQGKCFTLEAVTYTETVGQSSGLRFELNHDMYDYKPVYDAVPGWNLYFHQPREIFSENREILTGRQDHLFVRAGEAVEVNLDVLEFTNINNCNNSHDYQPSLCEEKSWCESIQKGMNCTTPWIQWQTPGLPECNNYGDMRWLYVETTKFARMNSCLPHCFTQLFKTNVVSRQYASRNQSIISIYYTNKAVLTMEERYAYDWNAFLADLGGSLGFLLGLSVIGVVSFLEEIVKLICGSKEREEEKQDLKEGEVIAPYDYVYKWKFATPFKVSPAVSAKIDQF